MRSRVKKEEEKVKIAAGQEFKKIELYGLIPARAVMGMSDVLVFSREPIRGSGPLQ